MIKIKSMKNKRKATGKSAWAFIAPVLTAALILLSPALHAKEREFYTLQAGSFPRDTSALQQFDVLSKGLNGKEIESLRVEKVGKFYTVRVGKFMNRNAAEKYLQASASRLSGAVILKAHIKDERIVKGYSGEAEDREVKISEPASLSEKAAEAKAIEIIQQIVSESHPVVPVTGTAGPEGNRDEPRVESISEEPKPVTAGYLVIKAQRPSDTDDDKSEKQTGPSMEQPKAASTGYLIVREKRPAETEDYASDPTQGGLEKKSVPVGTGYLIVKGKQPADAVLHANETPDEMILQTNVIADDEEVAEETENGAEIPDYQEDAAASRAGYAEGTAEESGVSAKAVESSSYTIQAGSFARLPDATKQFNSVRSGLKDVTPEHLRIEKVGKFYTVRIGQFMDRIAAEEYIRVSGPELANAAILKAYIREERIIEQYSEYQTVPDVVIAEDYQAAAGTKDEIESLLLSLQEPDEEPETPSQGEAIAKEEDRTNATGEVKMTQKPVRADKGQAFSDIKGKFYVSDYYSSDSGNYDFHVITSKLNLYIPETDDPGVYFKFDGRVRGKIRDGDVHEKIPDTDIHEFWVAYKFPNRILDISIGRQYIFEMYNTAVDGVDAKYYITKDLGIGIFGGLAPDKYDYSFNADFMSIGGYGFYDSEKYNVKVGYENLSYKGETDREYFSFNLRSQPIEKVRFNLISSASINQITDDFDIENINANVLYTFSKDLRVDVFYNYYKAMRYFASSKQFFDQIDPDDSYFLDTNSMTRVGTRADYKIAKNLKVYGSVVHQKRKIDDKDAMRYTGGIRKNDLFGFDVSARYRYIDNYTSRSDEFNVQLSRRFFNKLDVSVYASHEEEELDIENGFTTGLLTYGSSLYWDINRHFYLSLFAERYDEDDYYNTSLFTQVGYRLR